MGPYHRYLRDKRGFAKNIAMAMLPWKRYSL